jgi:hypothetical protein
LDHRQCPGDVASLKARAIRRIHDTCDMNDCVASLDEHVKAFRAIERARNPFNTILLSLRRTGQCTYKMSLRPGKPDQGPSNKSGTPRDRENGFRHNMTM